MLKADVKIGETYYWNVKDEFRKNHEGTFNVVVEGIESSYDIATVQSIETGKKFQIGLNTLQVHPSKLLRMYQFLKKTWHRTGVMPRNLAIPSDKYVELCDDKGLQKDQPVLILGILNYPDNTMVKFVDMKGKIHACHISHFPEVQINQQKYKQFYRGYKSRGDNVISFHLTPAVDLLQDFWEKMPK